MRKIKLKGRASQKEWIFIISEQEEELSLLELLQSREVPISSSCRGLGICQKCVFNEGELACEYQVRDIDKTIKIDYL